METKNTNTRKHGYSRNSRSWYLTLLTGGHTLLLSIAIPLYGEPTTASSTSTPSATTTESKSTTTESKPTATQSKPITLQQAVVSIFTGAAIFLNLMKKVYENHTNTATKQQTPTNTKNTASTTTYIPSSNTKHHAASTRSSTGCTQLTTVAQASGSSDCGLHALANAASIEECLRQGKPVLGTYVRDYHPRFYQKGLSALRTEGKSQQLSAEGLYTNDLTLVAKKHFNMDNCCVVIRPKNTSDLNNACFTTNQSIQAIINGHSDATGDATNNQTLRQMLRTLKQKDKGAVHCIHRIDRHQTSKYAHWVLVSHVKEHKNDRISTIYIDSLNEPYTSQPDAQACIAFDQDRYIKQLA